MNRALAVGGQVDLACPPPPVLASAVRPQQPILIEPVVPQGFRELVEYRCSQLGILCIPLVNRFQAGRPIFRVGNVLSYFDRQVNISARVSIISMYWSIHNKHLQYKHFLINLFFLYRLHLFWPTGCGYLYQFNNCLKWLFHRF